MKTTLLALIVAFSFGIQSLAIAEDEPAPAATQESAPADTTNAMPDTPAEPPAAAEQGNGSDAMPAPTESESK